MPNNNKKNIMNNLNKKNIMNNLSKKNNAAVKLLKLTSFIVFYVSNILILMYVLRLEKEKCECSREKWMRDFIKYVAMINLALPLLVLLMMPLLPSLKTSLIKLKSSVLPILIGLLGLALGVLGLAYVVVVLLYYRKLSQKPNCDCSLGPKRYFLLYPLVTILLAVVGTFVR
tara:strand:+ start:340 stop:855 length:516 start_codon:yes stop_codon:yes gene_type:complete